MKKEYIVRYKLMGKQVESVIHASDENELDEELQNLFDGLSLFKIKKVNFIVDQVTSLQKLSEHEFISS